MSINAKCSYADLYKAIHRPTCGCMECMDKWVAKNVADARMAMIEKIKAETKKYGQESAWASACRDIAKWLEAES